MSDLEISESEESRVNRQKQWFKDKLDDIVIVKSHAMVGFFEVPAFFVCKKKKLYQRKDKIIWVFPPNARVKVYDKDYESSALEFAKEFGYEDISKEYE